MEKETAIVMTTINLPKILENICDNITKYTHMNDVFMLIIGDKKTPLEIERYCKEIKDKYHVDIEYLSIEKQKKALKKFPKLLKLIPYNTPDRVMLGCIIAYLKGCTRVIAVDDDNFPTDSDFIGFHSITGTTMEIPLIKNDSGWFNVHSTLEDEKRIPFYPRGFPWKQRNEKSNERQFVTEEKKIVVNQGLVLEDSDVDAITRLFHPIRAIGFNLEYEPQFGLYSGVWSPFNFQNTCLSRELIPVYYRPLSTLRNGDIWTSYLINKLAQHFNDTITFGQPLVKQIRNVHDLFDDLEIELVNNKATDTFVHVLRNIPLKGDTYFKALGDLLKNSDKELKKVKSKTKEFTMIKEFFKEYKVWYNIISEVIDNGRYATTKNR